MKYEDRDEYNRAEELNQYFDFKLTEKHEKSERKYEKYLINNPAFIKAIEDVRAKYKITNKEPKDEYAFEWTSIFIEQHTKLLGKEAADVLIKEVSLILKQFDLPEKWRFYIEACIANGNPPRLELIANFDKLQVKRVTSEGEITLVLKPGLRREDYIAAWTGFTQYLGTPQSLAKPHTNSELSSQIFADKNKGMTYKQLAQKYFPGSYDRNDQAAEDRVKKIVRRERQRQLRGTTPPS